MKEKIRNLIKLISIAILFFGFGIISTLVYLNSFPVNTTIHPSNYFNPNIKWNQTSEFSNLMVFTSNNLSENLCMSMFPGNSCNSTYLVLPNPKNISIGDIITFDAKNTPYASLGLQFVTHRVIKIRMTEGRLEYLTKGDNVRYSDNFWINESQIIGKVVAILF